MKGRDRKRNSRQRPNRVNGENVRRLNGHARGAVPGTEGRAMGGSRMMDMLKGVANRLDLHPPVQRQIAGNQVEKDDSWGKKIHVLD